MGTLKKNFFFEKQLTTLLRAYYLPVYQTFKLHSKVKNDLTTLTTFPFLNLL